MYSEFRILDDDLKFKKIINKLNVCLNQSRSYYCFYVAFNIGRYIFGNLHKNSVDSWFIRPHNKTVNYL